jgi:HAD superfamily phosphoserine phosphatase-like hydrolase
LVAVLSIGSKSAASPLREYCRDTLGDEEFRRLRNLRDTCQVKFDAISRLLLESEGIRKGRDPSKADGAFPAAKPESAAPAAGIIHQPNAAWISPTGRNRFRHKVVAFDFDGTLLRGEKFVFSWELVWKNLGFGKAIQNELKREYRQEAGKSASRTDRIKAYSRWCERAVEKFKSRGLTRDQIRVMSKSLSLTKNCREALSLLRAEGMVTAIISGGISALLEDSFPDFREYFDFVFMNELIFSESGVVCGVNATAYDFEGKAEALALVRERAGTAPEATAFVGDHFNDEAVMLQVPTAIAYLPNDAVAESVSHQTVNEDDLLAIVPYLLVE